MENQLLFQLSSLSVIFWVEVATVGKEQLALRPEALKFPITLEENTSERMEM